jgi:hypothetical protein
MQWDYHVETIENNDVSELRVRLQALGLQGWELVTAHGVAGFANMLVVLKRPTPK